MTAVSVLIPARNEKFLNKTIKCALKSATGDIEVIVLLDGAPPTKPIPEWDRVRVLENEKAGGIGAASWKMANTAKGIHSISSDCSSVNSGREAASCDVST